MRMRTLLISAAAIAAAALPTLAMAQAALPTLLAAAIAATAQRTSPHAYDVSVENSRGSMRYSFDPSASGAARIRLISPEESTLDRQTRQSLQRIRRDADGDIWCASAKIRGSTNMQVVSEDAESITYSFTPSPAQAGGERAAGFVRYLRAQARVLKDTQDVASIRISAPAPFHASVARIDRFDMNIRCDVAANGRRFSAETRTHIAGSAIGNSFDESSVQRVSNLRARGG
jgi:hypothetical protein